MAIWLARLAIDRWRHNAGEGADAEPTVLTTETAHGPRIDAANDAGLAAGAKAGMRLADARALCPGLKTGSADGLLTAGGASDCTSVVEAERRLSR